MNCYNEDYIYIDQESFEILNDRINNLSVFALITHCLFISLVISLAYSYISLYGRIYKINNILENKKCNEKDEDDENIIENCLSDDSDTDSEEVNDGNEIADSTNNSADNSTDNLNEESKHILLEQSDNNSENSEAVTDFEQNSVDIDKNTPADESSLFSFLSFKNHSS